MVWLGFVDVMIVVVIVVVAVAMVIVVVVMVSNSAKAASHKLRQMIVLQHLSCQHF
jgi:flagellar basal body-associated protein FliL